jgi:hypothetical protein
MKSGIVGDGTQFPQAGKAAMGGELAATISMQILY